MPKLHEIKGVEVFAAGVWNGDEYTTDDLDSMVEAFAENKDKIRPFLKLGHDENQKLLQIDGMPAAGWISELKRVGKKLIATFSDVPEKIYELIQNKAYRKVSSEIYWNISINGKDYNKFLSAVALLGADMPAVTSLDSILGMFTGDAFSSVKSYASDKNGVTIKEYQFETEGVDTMSDQLREQLEAAQKQIKEMESKQVELTGQLSDKEAALAGKETEISTLKEFKLVKEQEAKDLADKAAKAERENHWNELEKIGLPPSAKEAVFAILGQEKKQYTLNDGKEKLSDFEAMAKVLKLYKEALKVNFEKNSISGDDSANTEIQKLNQKIEEYSKANKCDYATAYKAVMADQHVKLESEKDSEE